MILAGDIGGTHVRLCRVEGGGRGARVIELEVLDSSEHDSLDSAVADYMRRHPGPVAQAGFGIPGPVVGDRVKTTNLGWVVDRARLSRQLGAPVVLVNDLAAAALGIDGTPPDRLAALQAGPQAPPRAGAAQAVIAPGTGLGEAATIVVGGTRIAIPSEGSHTDFGARNEEEIELWRFLAQRHGRVSYERIVSGPGLVAVYEFYADRLGQARPPWRDDEDQAAAISRAALEDRCRASRAALERFCAVLGAEAGNLALKVLATGGVFIAGGIAPKILPALQGGAFLDAFRDKGRYVALMRQIPVHVVLDPVLALRGAAVAAAAGG